eukprot:4438232-Prymnesium_polylepis.1
MARIWLDIPKIPYRTEVEVGCVWPPREKLGAPRGGLREALERAALPARLNRKISLLYTMCTNYSRNEPSKLVTHNRCTQRSCCT